MPKSSSSRATRGGVREKGTYKPWVCLYCGTYHRTKGWLSWHVKNQCLSVRPDPSPAPTSGGRLDAKEWIKRHGLPKPQTRV